MKKVLSEEFEELKMLVGGLSKIEGLPIELFSLIGKKINKIEVLCKGEVEQITEKEFNPDLELVPEPELEPESESKPELEIESKPESELESEVKIDSESKDNSKSKIYVEKKQVLALNDKYRFNDKKFGFSFSINDRYRFLRELFSSKEEMQEFFDKITSSDSYETSLSFFYDLCNEKTDEDCKNDFETKLKEYYNLLDL